MPRAKPKRDIYQEVTDKILDFIDRGNLPPWRHPIQGRGNGDGWPKSLATGNRYRGVNVFLLAITAWIEGYSSDHWLTFNQAKKKNAKIMKGEKGSLVVFWKQYTKTDNETGEEVNLPVLRHYNVFNAEQCENLKLPDAVDDAQPSVFVPIEEAVKIVNEYKNPPTIEHGGKSAAYFRGEDKIKIAAPECFTDSESYFATLFHEMAHSTNHKTRLNREREEGSHVFGSPSYSKEELVAEFGSAFLCASAGISPPTIEQSAAYIEGWRKKLSDDKKLVVQAAGLGQRAADHILGITFENNASEASAQPGHLKTLVDPSRALPQGLLSQAVALQRLPEGSTKLPVGTAYIEAIVSGAASIDNDWQTGRIDTSEAQRLADNWINVARDKLLIVQDDDRSKAFELLSQVQESASRMQRLLNTGQQSPQPSPRAL